MVSLCLVSSSWSSTETYEPFQRGKLDWSSPWRQCLFAGYLNQQFRLLLLWKMKWKWFITGDLGYLNAQGYLIVTDRWRRFIRIAGENQVCRQSNTGWWNSPQNRRTGIGWQRRSDGCRCRRGRGRKSRAFIFLPVSIRPLPKLMNPYKKGDSRIGTRRFHHEVRRNSSARHRKNHYPLLQQRIAREKKTT